MADKTRKMTFTLPEPLASSFTRSVPARHRSRYVADALTRQLADAEQRLIRSCEAANNDMDVLTIEQEFDALPDAVAEDVVG